jgi:hypothetical protein
MNATPNTEGTNAPLTLRLHYYLKDANEHSMEAVAFNECQKNFLLGIKRIQAYLDEPVEVRVSAKEEGGVVDVLQILTSNPVAIILATAFVTAFFNAKFHPKQPITEETKSKLTNILEIKAAIQSGNLSESEFDHIAENDSGLKKLKSDFFKSARTERSIIKVKLDIPDPQVIIVVSSAQFDDFILKEKNETDETTRECKIYIASPILLKGFRGIWRGIHEDEHIDFKVTDKDFLAQVANRSVTFGSGTYLNCQLKTKTVVEQNTQKESVHHEVVEVINYGEDGGLEQPVPRRIKKIQTNDNQLELPFAPLREPSNPQSKSQ